ncbi:MAG: hypothetical protein JWM53_5929, partial [bacterium]|nr:hypothetical protein [bacterium]
AQPAPADDPPATVCAVVPGDVSAYVDHFPDLCNQPDGTLNACLQGDEDQSGPVFEAVAGRTRRNSGLPNATCRPCSEVQPLVPAYRRSGPASTSRSRSVRSVSRVASSERL